MVGCEQLPGLGVQVDAVDHRQRISEFKAYSHPVLKLHVEIPCATVHIAAKAEHAGTFRDRGPDCPIIELLEDGVFHCRKDVVLDDRDKWHRGPPPRPKYRFRTCLSSMHDQR